MSVPQHIVVDFIINEALKFPQIKKIVLFGSRARGESQPTSDYDLAIYTEDLLEDELAKFMLTLSEKKPTLCEFNFTLVSDETNPELLKRIKSEGKNLLDDIA